MLKPEQIEHIIEWLYGSLVTGQVDYKRPIYRSGFQVSITYWIMNFVPAFVLTATHLRVQEHWWYAAIMLY